MKRPAKMTAAAAAGDLAALGSFAMRYIRPGQAIGLGTGRAASAFIEALGKSGIRVRGVPTSKESERLARRLGIELVTLDQVGVLDADFDGADEVDPRLNLIKGYGGALVREKIVASAARRRIILVGVEKLVKRLGQRGSLPVEIVPFAAPIASGQIRKLGLRPAVRTGPRGKPFLTDNGNLIFDCALSPISNPARLERDLLAIPGVVGTGLFIGIADIVLVAAPDGSVKVMKRGGRR